MTKVTGIGGIFFKCNDPTKVKDWYKENLAINTDQWGSCFEWRQADDGVKKGFTQWSPMANNSEFFGDQEFSC